MAESHLALSNTLQAREYLEQCQPQFTELRLPAYIQRTQTAMKVCLADTTP